MLFLPSKKFIYVVVIALLVVAGVLGVVNRRSVAPEGEKNGSLRAENDFPGTNALIAKVANEDTDGDGLKDWEESLWGTNINQVDSDGDGFSDKEEADEGYDPADAESNPTTEKKIDPVTETRGMERFSPDPGNFTQSIAYTLGANLGASPEDIRNASSGDIVDEASAREIAGYVAGFDVKIPESELKISNDNSKEAVQKYISDIAQNIPRDPYPQKSTDEIFEEAINSKNFDVIDEYIAHYQKTADILKTITVPSDFARNHKRQIELTLTVKKTFESIKEIDNDALKTILGMERYFKAQDELVEVVKDFSKLVSSHK